MLRENLGVVPIFIYIYIVYINAPKYSIKRIGTKESEILQKTSKGRFVRKYISSLAMFLKNCLTFELPPAHHAPRDSCECSLWHPKVFVLHQKGQPLPEEWKERVPPSTILIVVEPGDWPAHNCFEAQPTTLEHLRKESQLDESKHSKPCGVPQ